MGRPDDARRKQLKAQAQRELSARRARLEEVLRESNPADLRDPQWAKNHLALHHLERELQENRSRVLPREAIGRDVIVHRERTLDGTPCLRQANPTVLVSSWSVSGRLTYLHCLRCEQLLPTATERRLACACDNVAVDFYEAVRVSGLYENDTLHCEYVWVLREPWNVRLADLLAKAPDQRSSLRSP